MPTVDPLFVMVELGPSYAVPGWPALQGNQSIFGSAESGVSKFTQMQEPQDTWLTSPTTGTIAGVVTEGGIPVPFARVYVYFQRSGEKIGGAVCDASGNFTLPWLDPTVPGDPDDGKYFVVALDPRGGNRYNALIYDRVVPS